jgi:hypothetical protein
LVARNSEINNILINLGTTADQLNKSGADLVGVIDNMNSITGALAHNQGSLEGYITNTDSLNLNTTAVLSGGHAAELNAGFQRLSSFATQLNQLMTTLVPETFHFANDHSKATGQFIWQDAKNLVFQIGAATGQSNNSGFFLRQYANGADPCGLIGPTCVATNAPPTAPSLPNFTNCLPNIASCLPGGLPTLPLPLPPLPKLPVPTPSLPIPTPPPLPTAPAGAGPSLPIPGPTLPLGLAQQASDQVATPLALWGWL